MKRSVVVFVIFLAVSGVARGQQLSITNSGGPTLIFNAPTNGAYDLQMTFDCTNWFAINNLLLTNGPNFIPVLSGFDYVFFRMARAPDLAPASIAGKIFNVTITSGSGNFAKSGTYTFGAAAAGNTYNITGGPGIPNSHGYYTYTRTGNVETRLSFDDSLLGFGNYGFIYFQTPTSGLIDIYTSNSASRQTGTFTTGQ